MFLSKLSNRWSLRVTSLPTICTNRRASVKRFFSAMCALLECGRVQLMATKNTEPLAWLARSIGKSRASRKRKAMRCEDKLNVVSFYLDRWEGIWRLRGSEIDLSVTVERSSSISRRLREYKFDRSALASRVRGVLFAKSSTTSNQRSISDSDNNR